MTDFIITSFVFFGIATFVFILIRMSAQSPLNHKEQDNQKETANSNTEDFPFENISTEQLKKIQKDTSILAVKSVIGSILKSRGVPDDEIISLTLANNIPKKTFTQTITNIFHKNMLLSPQKKICMMFLETFEKELRLNDYNFTYAFEEIKGDVEKAISESHVIDSSINAGKSHASIVLNLIEKRCRWKLVSGELHVYRGMLGMYSGGYKKLWSYVVEKIAECEGMPKETIAEYESEIDVQISQAG